MDVLCILYIQDCCVVFNAVSQTKSGSFSWNPAVRAAHLCANVLYLPMWIPPVILFIETRILWGLWWLSSAPTFWVIHRPFRELGTIKKQFVHNLQQHQMPGTFIPSSLSLSYLALLAVLAQAWGAVDKWPHRAINANSLTFHSSFLEKSLWLHNPGHQ